MSTEHALTYKNIKTVLVREFGEKAFNAAKDTVHSLVLEESNRRLAAKPAQKEASLADDVEGWLEVRRRKIREIYNGRGTEKNEKKRWNWE